MANLGTKLYRIFFGEFVGEDKVGNRYYRSKKKKYGIGIGRPGTERRWVEYKKHYLGVPEPSVVPAEWHAWLHHSSDKLPESGNRPKKYKWEKDHIPNLTGTELAYRPPGHILKGGQRDKATGDYNAWEPE